jgi:polar amino acid transport system substrate-binding protein
MNRRTTLIGAAALPMLLAAAPRRARAQAAGCADSLVGVKARGKLLAGVKFDTPPFGYLDDNNQPAGFDLDLMRAVAAHIGVAVEFVKVTSVSRIPMLLSGNADLIAASMTHTRERGHAIDFSETYYTGGQSLLVKKDSPIAGVGDLAGKRVAVQQGTTLEKTIERLAPAAQVTAFRDYDAAWLALAQGRADVLTGSLTILQGFAGHNEGFKIVGGLLSTEPFGVGIRKGDWTMRDAVDDTLQDLWLSGEYAELYKARLGTEPTTPIEVWPA